MSNADIGVTAEGTGEAQCVPFQAALRSGADAVALTDADHDRSCSYAQLRCWVETVADAFGRGPRCLALLFAHNDIPSIVCYLAALEAGHAVFLAPIRIEHPGAAALIQRYRPEIVLWRDGALAASVRAAYRSPEDVFGYRLARRFETPDQPPHGAVGVLLSTSGSSGSPKAVQLPSAGLGESAVRVAEALGMNGSVRVLANLPFGYVYGLSVLNSTLCSGGSLVLLSGSTADRRFWARAARTGVTMIPTVSQTLELMRQHGIDSAQIPTLRKLTHSGDRLDPGLFSWVDQRLSRSGVEVYLMYGQTEAGGRMTVLQPGHLPHLHRSVGTPLRSCEIRIDTDGEILFRGPGVMLGYARGREDLDYYRPGEAGGFLRTGDRGYLDERGFLYVSGRVSRDRKIFGKRISLDDVEAFARGGAQAAAVESEGIISIFFEPAVPSDAPSAIVLSRHFQLPPQMFRLIALARLPCTASGKIAYDQLTQMAGAQAHRSTPSD